MKTILLLLAMLSATQLAAKTVEFNKDRTIYFRGVIKGNVLEEAAKIEMLSAQSSDPIYFVLNSPGGSVLPGIQVISAMNLAKERGVEFHCVAPVMAASMAFQFFANCDVRYAFKYSLLLWHPMKTALPGGLDKEQLLYASQRIRALEKPLLKELFLALKITKAQFIHHYKNETMWIGEELNELTPEFLTLIDDVKGIDGLFLLN